MQHFAPFCYMIFSQEFQLPCVFDRHVGHQVLLSKMSSVSRQKESTRPSSKAEQSLVGQGYTPRRMSASSEPHLVRSASTICLRKRILWELFRN